MEYRRSLDHPIGDDTHESMTECQENRPHHGRDRHRHRAFVDRRGALLLLTEGAVTAMVDGALY